MIDLNYIRNNQDIVRTAIINKKSKVDFDAFLVLDEKRRTLQKAIEDIRASRNVASAGQDVARGKELKMELQKLTGELTSVEADFNKAYKLIPNIPSEDTPIGRDEDENVVARQVGVKPVFSFKPKEHWELGKALGIIETDKAGEISGSRFAYLLGDLVLVQQALVNLTFKTLTDEATLKAIADKAGLKVSTKPFVPVVPPVFIKPDVMEKMARLEPREERYHLAEDDLYLVGSAEHTLGPLHMNEIIPEEKLPLRYIGLSPAFRREAGSHGKDVKGILRLHQFDKLEMESFALASDGLAEQDFIVAIQEHLLGLLGLPYQVVRICTGDMGGPDMRQMDIETWMPGQDRYRETNTSDYMGSYQSMRLQTKARRVAGGTEYVHMNDATAFAIGRTLIAIMENYQQEDGSIVVPEVLRAIVGKSVIK